MSDNENNAPIVRHEHIPVAQSIVEITPVAIEQMRIQMNAIQAALRGLMTENLHYGKIPGTDKPTLLKPGAEKLCMLFRLSAQFNEAVIELPKGHREVRSKCMLLANGNIVAESVGVCTTMEARYRYRKASRKCPSCGQESIIKGKAEYGGGWLCYAAKGGCIERNCR